MGPFETFRIVQEPTDALKFPPAQGLILATDATHWRPSHRWSMGQRGLSVWCNLLDAAGVVTWALAIGECYDSASSVESQPSLLPAGILGYCSQRYWGGAAQRPEGLEVSVRCPESCGDRGP